MAAGVWGASPNAHIQFTPSETVALALAEMLASARALLSLAYISSFLYCSNSFILLQVNIMSKRISISCPDHVYKLLSGLAELQSRPMSKIVVELLEASYPALNSVYHTLIRLEAEKRRTDHSMASGVDQIMTEFSGTINALVGEVQLELSDITPPYSNTGATLSQNTPQTPKLRGV